MFKVYAEFTYPDEEPLDPVVHAIVRTEDEAKAIVREIESEYVVAYYEEM